MSRRIRDGSHLHELIALDGLPRLVTADDDETNSAVDLVMFRNPRGVVQTMEAQDWPNRPLPPREYSQETIDQTLQEAEAARNREAQKKRALRQSLAALAGSVEGRDVNFIGLNELADLVACLLWNEGALTPDGTVKPIEEWLKP